MWHFRVLCLELLLGSNCTRTGRARGREPGNETHDTVECFLCQHAARCQQLKPFVISDKPKGLHFNSLSILLTTACFFFFFPNQPSRFIKTSPSKACGYKTPFFYHASCMKAEDTMIDLGNTQRYMLHGLKWSTCLSAAAWQGWCSGFRGSAWRS